MSETDQELSSLDTIFDLLSNPRRRFVLHYLKRVEEPVQLTELAAQIAAKENDVPVDELTSQQRKRAYVSLYQTHVPKLEEVGVVTYDSETGNVALTAKADDIDEQLDRNGTDVPWQWLYLGVALAGLVGVLLAPLAGGGNAIQFRIGLFVLGAIAVIALANYVYARRSKRDTLALIEDE
ncbi:DUF7344 domain-containing protein [Salinarchaeum laminariae]|uniref:DUF7344 domain-containing protein n=1 Tax=Salinarchaeum laminariae TaxID=869888 RepID=UPI0020BF07B5|nr:hypothetical protein [Salinarchaeum laminariae]